MARKLIQSTFLAFGYCALLIFSITLPSQLIFWGGLGCFVLLAIFFLNDPFKILLLIISLIPLEYLGSIEIGSVTIRLSQILTLFLFISLAFNWLASGKKIGLNWSIFSWFVLFLAAGIFSLLFAENFTRGISVWLFIVFSFAFGYFVSAIVNSEEKLKKAVKVILFAAAVFALFGLYQFIGSYLGWPTGLRSAYQIGVFAFPRIQSTFLEPLYFANFLIVPVSVLFLGYVAEGRLNKTRVIILFLLILALLLTFSRGGYLGVGAAFIVGVVLLFVFRLTPKKRIFGKIFGACLGVLGIVVLLGSFSNINLETFVERAQDVTVTSADTGRLDNFQRAFTFFQASPIHGVGVGNYGVVAGGYSKEWGWGIVNNEYLEVLAETGLVGFIPFAIFLLAIFIRGFRVIRIAKDNQARLLQVCLLAGLAGILVQYLTFSTLYIMHIWLFIGLTIASQNIINAQATQLSKQTND